MPFARKERTSGGFVVGPELQEGERNETACAFHRDDARAECLCDDAAPARAADLSGRIADPDDTALPNASTASAASAAGHLPGWLDGSGRDELPDAAASAPGSAAAWTLRRTRLIEEGRRCLASAFSHPRIGIFLLNLGNK